MNQAFICDAVRTPFGRFGGTTATLRADDLAALPLKALLERNPGLDPARIDDVIYGCANQAGKITATSRVWRCCWPDCRKAYRAVPLTACAVPALMRSASQRARLKAAKLN